MPSTPFSYEHLQLLTRIAGHLAECADLREGLGAVLDWLAAE